MNRHIMTPAEAAIELQCSVTTVIRFCRDGKLDAQRDGRFWVVDAESVEALVASGYDSLEACSHNGFKSKMTRRKRVDLFRRHNQAVGI